MENGSPLTPEKPAVEIQLTSNGSEKVDEQKQTPPPQEMETTQEVSKPFSSPGISSTLKGLMDREKAIREQQEQLKHLERDYHEAQALKRLAQTDPLDFLERIGVRTDQLTSRLSERENPDPTREISEKIAKLEQEFQKRQQQEEERQRQSAMQEAQSAVESFILEHKEEFPLTASAGLHTLVYESILNHLNSTGESLSEAEAAKEVEDYLASIKAKWQPPSDTAPTPVMKSPTTLTNSLAAQTPVRASSDAGLLSEEESLMRAAAKLKFV